MATVALDRLSRGEAAIMPTVERWSDKKRKSIERIHRKCECTLPRSIHKCPDNLHTIDFLQWHLNAITSRAKYEYTPYSMIELVKLMKKLFIFLIKWVIWDIYCLWRVLQSLAEHLRFHVYRQSKSNRKRTISSMQTLVVALLPTTQNPSNYSRQKGNRYPSRQRGKKWL